MAYKINNPSNDNDLGIYIIGCGFYNLQNIILTVILIVFGIVQSNNITIVDTKH